VSDCLSALPPRLFPTPTPHPSGACRSPASTKMDGINGQFIDWGFKSATVVKRLPVDPKFYPGSDPKFFGE
jgi:hypothetical protein